MELPILIFLVVLVGEILSTIGKDTITDFVHKFLQLFSTSSIIKEQRNLRAKILKDRAELAGTSAQDEFSKWAKLRRKLDKSVADLELLNASTLNNKTAFASKFKKLLWIIMTVLPFIFSSYHRKAAVFYLPLGWFGPSSWYLSLPKAPTGALSVTLFTMATKRTLKVVKEIIVEVWKGGNNEIPSTSNNIKVEVEEEEEEVPLGEKEKSEL